MKANQVFDKNSFLKVLKNWQRFIKILHVHIRMYQNVYFIHTLKSILKELNENKLFLNLNQVCRSHAICHADPPESSLCDSKICSFVVGVSSGLLFFVPIPLFRVPSGRVTRQNRSWPIIIEGPPSAPQQGISMVELTYPNLTPSTIPARDAGQIYPNYSRKYEEIKSCTHPNSSPFYEQVSNGNPRSPPSASVHLEL